MSYFWTYPERMPPISELKSRLIYEQLIEDIQQVLETLVTLEREVMTHDGDWYKAEIRPSRTSNQVIDGVVLVFNDISVQKQMLLDAERRASYQSQLIDTIENSLLELDSELRVLTANTAFYRLFQVEPQETLGRALYDLGNGQWNIPELRRLLGEIIPQQRFVQDFIVQHDFPQIGRLTMRLNARQIQELDRILLVITELKAE